MSSYGIQHMCDPLDVLDDDEDVMWLSDVRDKSIGFSSDISEAKRYNTEAEASSVVASLVSSGCRLRVAFLPEVATCTTQ